MNILCPQREGGEDAQKKMLALVSCVSVTLTREMKEVRNFETHADVMCTLPLARCRRIVERRHPPSKFSLPKVANFCGRVKITCFRLYKAVGSAPRAPAREKQGGRASERERALSVERRGEEELQLGIERVTELGREGERERRHAGPHSTGWT